MKLEVRSITGIPDVRHGDDLGALVAEAASRERFEWSDGHIVVVAHKVISKAEGSTRSLSAVSPSVKADELAALTDKDPRLVQVILDESAEVVRSERGVLICRTKHGFVCANAGVDHSNVDSLDTVVLLPTDPDRSASKLRHRLKELTGTQPAVVITDSFGRAWRTGQCETAIGCAGLNPVNDLRGQRDAYGKPLSATAIAVADQVAAAADLARKKDSREPVILITGLQEYVTFEDGPGAKPLLRPSDEDLFR